MHTRDESSQCVAEINLTYGVQAQVVCMRKGTEEHLCLWFPLQDSKQPYPGNLVVRNTIPLFPTSSEQNSSPTAFSPSNRMAHFQLEEEIPPHTQFPAALHRNPTAGNRQKEQMVFMEGTHMQGWRDASMCQSAVSSKRRWSLPK